MQAKGAFFCDRQNDHYPKHQNNGWEVTHGGQSKIRPCLQKVHFGVRHQIGVKQIADYQQYEKHRQGKRIEIRLCFGHTHQQLTSAEGAMLIMNPGSIGCDGEYGMIEIDENTGIVTATEYPRSDIPPLRMNTINSQ